MDEKEERNEKVEDLAEVEKTDKKAVKEVKEKVKTNTLTLKEIEDSKEYVEVLTDKLAKKIGRMFKNEQTGEKIIIREGITPNIVMEKSSYLVEGHLDVLSNGFAFLRDKTLKSSKNDIYVSPTMIRLFRLKTGDKLLGFVNPKILEDVKYPNLMYLFTINDLTLPKAFKKREFEDLTPIYPTERFPLAEVELDKTTNITNRLIDMFAPIGKGQRGLIVSQPKTGKTTVIKSIAQSIMKLKEDIELMVLLIDERPEEVTEIEEIVKGHVISSTFDEKPEEHIHIAEFALEIAKRKVEAGKHVVLLLDSITRLARAYNLVVPSSGKVLSGGFDPTALYKPKHFFGAARNTKDAGSLTILATALVDTGSRMDDLIYEEFKGTGNMELHLSREMAERRIYPAIDIVKSGTRRDELLYTEDEKEIIDKIRVNAHDIPDVEFTKRMIALINSTKNNEVLFKSIQNDPTMK